MDFGVPHFSTSPIPTECSTALVFLTLDVNPAATKVSKNDQNRLYMTECNQT